MLLFVCSKTVTLIFFPFPFYYFSSNALLSVLAEVPALWRSSLFYIHSTLFLVFNSQFTNHKKIPNSLLYIWQRFYLASLSDKTQKNNHYSPREYKTFESFEASTRYKHACTLQLSLPLITNLLRKGSCHNSTLVGECNSYLVCICLFVYTARS